MRRAVHSMALSYLMLAPLTPRVIADEGSLLRAVITPVIVAELSSHDSQESAWYNEKSKDKEKWMKMKVFGRESKTRLASWTEQSKTWVWLEEPQKYLSVQLTKLELRDKRLEFAATARTKARFKAWGRIPRLVQGAAGGEMWMEIEIAGSAAVGLRRLQDSQITTFKATFHDLQFNNDLASPLEDLVEDGLNDYVKRKNEKLCEKLEKSINKVTF